MIRQRLAILFCFAVSCQGVEGDLLLPVPQPDLRAPFECTTEVLGDGLRCAPAVDWKELAERGCAAQGLGLIEFMPFGECGMQLFRHGKAVCCPRLPEGACRPETQGGPTSCKSDRDWHRIITLSCSVQHQVPTGVMLLEPCAAQTGGFRYVRYLCCPPPPPLR